MWVNIPYIFHPGMLTIIIARCLLVSKVSNHYTERWFGATPRVWKKPILEFLGMWFCFYSPMLKSWLKWPFGQKWFNVFFPGTLSKSNDIAIWVFPKIGIPQNGWFIMEKPTKMGWFGGTTIFGNIRILPKRWMIEKEGTVGTWSQVYVPSQLFVSPMFGMVVWAFKTATCDWRVPSGKLT